MFVRLCCCRGATIPSSSIACVASHFRQYSSLTKVLPVRRHEKSIVLRCWSISMHFSTCIGSSVTPCTCLCHSAWSPA